MTFFQGGIIGSGCHIFTYINCISLLDNAPKPIVGCIIQKRLTYIPPRSNLNPPIQHMSNSVPHKTFFDVILTSRYFYDISSFSYVRIALKKSSNDINNPFPNIGRSFADWHIEEKSSKIVHLYYYLLILVRGSEKGEKFGL